MTEYVYILFDKVAGRCGSAMQFANDAVAVREICLKFQKSPYYKDMELRRIGAVDIKTGWLVDCDTCVVALPPAPEAAPTLDETLNK